MDGFYMSTKCITAFKKVSQSCDRSAQSGRKTGNYKAVLHPQRLQPHKCEKKERKSNKRQHNICGIKPKWFCGKCYLQWLIYATWLYINRLEILWNKPDNKVFKRGKNELSFSPLCYSLECTRKHGHSFILNLFLFVLSLLSFWKRGWKMWFNSMGNANLSS